MVRKTYSYIRTYFGDVVVRETKMGFDVKGEEGAEAADATGSGGVPVTVTYTADRNDRYQSSRGSSTQLPVNH